MKFTIQLDQHLEKASFSDSIDSPSVQNKWRSVVVLALILIMAVFALPGYAAKLTMVNETKEDPGVNIAALGRDEISKRIGDRIYWGRLVAAENRRLTSFEINEIGRAIVKYSGEYGLPPEVIVAIIKVESSGRVSAVSPKGAQGLMQVMPFWKDELGIEGTLFDIDNNIRAGTHILAEYIKEHGYEEGIARYYRGSLPVNAQGYYGKVQRAMQI